MISKGTVPPGAGDVWQRSGRAFRITLSARLGRPATVELPVAGSHSQPDLIAAVRYDSTTRKFAVAASKVNASRDGNVVVAQTTRFSSWFAAVLDPAALQAGARAAARALGQAAGFRAPDPRCPGEHLSADAVTVEGAPPGDEPLLACAYRSRDGRINLRVVNNRTFPTLVALPRSAESYDLITANLKGRLAALAADITRLATEAQPAGHVAMPAGATLALRLSAQPDAEEFMTSEPTSQLLVYSLMFDAITTASATAATVQSLYSCFTGFALGTAPESFAQVLAQARARLTDCKELVGADFAKGLGSKAVAAIYAAAPVLEALVGRRNEPSTHGTVRLTISEQKQNLSQAHVFLPAQCGYLKPTVAPAELDPGCTGGSPKLSGVQWQRWGSENAVGSGRASLRVCQPDCPRGRYVDKPVELTAFRIRHCGTRRIYSRLRTHYPAGAPERPGDYVFDFHCEDGSEAV